MLNDNILEKINIITIFDGNIDDQSVCQLLKKDNICISRATVNRCRKKLGFKYKPKIKIQKLSNDHVDRSLDLIDYVSKEQISFDNLLFSDESRFCLNGDRDYTWGKRGCIINQVPEYYSKQFANPNHSPWTEDEDDKILELVNTIGHKWTVLQYYFPSRSSSSIKFRYNFLSRKKHLKKPLFQLPSIGIEGFEWDEFISKFN